VSTDFETAKALLRRAMVSPDPPTKPKVAAGCLLFQILQDESHFGVNGGVSDTELVQVLQDTLQLFDEMEKEDIDASKHKSSIKRGTGLQVGDRVEADYALEGTYYPAVVESIVGEEVTVCYDDDGSTETLPERSVHLAVPLTAMQISLGSPLSDEEAFRTENTDNSFIFAKYEVKYDFAVLKEKAGESCNTSALYEEAADGAMANNKMKTVRQWSLKAAELC
jgi:elongation factor 2 kinase